MKVERGVYERGKAPSAHTHHMNFFLLLGVDVVDHSVPDFQNSLEHLPNDGIAVTAEHSCFGHVHSDYCLCRIDARQHGDGTGGVGIDPLTNCQIHSTDSQLVCFRDASAVFADLVVELLRILVIFLGRVEVAEGHATIQNVVHRRIVRDAEILIAERVIQHLHMMNGHLNDHIQLEWGIELFQATL